MMSLLIKYYLHKLETQRIETVISKKQFFVKFHFFASIRRQFIYATNDSVITEKFIKMRILMNLETTFYQMLCPNRTLLVIMKYVY